MISVQEALDLVEETVSISMPKKVPLLNCLGLILAEDIHSPIEMPPFDQSAMDGYAVNFDPSIETYKVVGEIQAGSGETHQLFAGEAVRIFTGAAVPESATTVVRQEDVVRVGDEISFTAIKDNANIRPKGEQIQKGELAMEAGMELNPAAIGFIATLGITELLVYARPRIAIVTTGNELVKPGKELAHGQIYESNSIMLEAALKYFGFVEVEHYAVKDTYEGTVEALKSAVETCDLLIVSGGISVGDYDFVGKALNELDFEQVFYKVRQKPGKPLMFGTIGQKLVFALPGNPAAALTSFYMYILPSLNKLTGGGFEGCQRTELPLKDAYKRRANRTEILKAYASEMEVEILHSQSSAMLSSFSEANALVIVPEDKDEVEAGEFVLTLLL